MACDPGRWRRCDPGDGSEPYFFHLDSAETAWEPPPGVDAATIKDFGFDDEHVLDELGIDDVESGGGKAHETVAPASTLSSSSGGEPTATLPNKTAASNGSSSFASEAAQVTIVQSKDVPGSLTQQQLGAPVIGGFEATAAALGAEGGSDSTDCPTPPPLPPIAASASLLGPVLPPPGLGDAPPGGISAVPALSLPQSPSGESLVPDSVQLPLPALPAGGDAGEAAGPALAAGSEAVAPPSLPASLFAWGLHAQPAALEPAAGAAGAASSSSASLAGAIGSASLVLGVWGRGSGTASSIVGTLGHPIGGGSVAYTGMWETRRGETRGNSGGDTFWFNRETGETRWEKPDNADVGSDRASLVSASLNQPDVHPSDPLMGVRPALEASFSAGTGGRGRGNAALADPDVRVEAVWGGAHRSKDGAGDASSLLLLAGLLPTGLAESWAEAEAEAREGFGGGAEAGALTTPTGLDLRAEVACRAAAARGVAPPWLTLPTIPRCLPTASPSDPGCAAPKPDPAPHDAAVPPGPNWTLRSALPSLWQSHHAHPSGHDAAGDGDAADEDEDADGSAQEDDAVLEVLRCAQGTASSTSLYRRLLALLQLMQRHGDDAEWAELLSSNGYILPRLLLSCLTPTAPPAVCRAASQCLFLAAQLDDTVARLIVTPMQRPSLEPPAASSPPAPASFLLPWDPDAAGESQPGAWRHWRGLEDAIGASASGIVAALRGWRLRWPRGPLASGVGDGADASAGPAGRRGWSGQASALVSATAPLIDEESLFSFCLFLELALGACFSEPVPTDALLPKGQAQPRAVDAAAEGNALRCLRDAETRAGLCWLCAAAAVCAPRGRTSGAAVAALSAVVMACEEAGMESEEADSRPVASPAGFEAVGGGAADDGRIAGMTEALRRDPSLLPQLSTTLLEVLVRVEHRDGRGAVATASPEQIMAATSLIKRLLQPGALPDPVEEAAGAREQILFFSSDLRVLVDICVREVVDLPDTDQLRAEFLLLLRDVLLFSQWAREGLYRADDIVSVVSDLVTTGAADAEPAVRDAAEALLVDCRELLDD